MLNKKKHFIIVLTRDHLTIAKVKEGSVIQAERLALDSSKWEEAWSGGLHMFDLPLRQLLARFGGVGKVKNADLIFSSPGSVCRVEMGELDAGASVAKLKAGLNQSVGRSNPADAVALYSSDSSTVALGIADEESNLQKLFAWMNRCQVAVDQMVPRDAWVTHQAMQNAISAADDTAILYFGERSSFIGYCEDGEPKLARLIEIGYNKLAEVYERVMNGDHEGSGSLEAESSESKKVAGIDGFVELFRGGIPVSKSKAGDQAYLKELLPAMSPILQRISIEVKQTFRFASSIERTPSRLMICGPGAAIPSVGVAMSQSIDMHIDILPESKDFAPSEIFGYGTVELCAATILDLELKLLPKAAQEIQVRKGFDRALKAGAFGAAVLLGGQYLHADRVSEKLDASLNDQSTEILRIEADQSRRESIRGMAGTIGSTAKLIEDSMGKRIDWVGFLGSLPNEDHPMIQIHELQGRMNSARPTVNLSGISTAVADGEDASQVLSEYIKALREIPNVKRIEIGSTSRSLVDESNWGLNFILTIEIETMDGDFSPYIALGRVSQGGDR